MKRAGACVIPEQSENNPAEIQMQRRLEGFMQYLSEEHKDLTIHDIVLHKEDTDGNRRILDAFLKNIPKPYWELFLIPVFIKWQVICTKRGGSWQDLWDMTFYTKYRAPENR